MKFKYALVYVSLFLFLGLQAYPEGEQETTAKTISYEGITLLEIEGERFDLTVTGTEGGTVSGEIIKDPRDDLRVSRSGNTLRIKVDNGWWLFDTRSEGSMNLKVPGDCDLKLVTASGKIRIQDLGEGRLDVTSASGDLSARNLQRKGRFFSFSGAVTLTNMSGAVKVKTFSGEIQAKDLGAGLQAETISGNIIVRAAAGNLELQSVSGSQDVRDWLAPRTSRFSSVSGEVKILGLESESARVEYRTSSGAVNLWGRRTGASGTSGSGDVRLEVSTVSGGITIE